MKCEHCQAELVGDAGHICERCSVRRWLRRRMNKLAQLFALVAQRPPDDDGWCRVSGAVVCAMCGEVYYDHASDPHEPWMTMVCDGRRVKL